MLLGKDKLSLPCARVATCEMTVDYGGLDSAGFGGADIVWMY